MNDELIQINADQYKVSKAIKRKIDKNNLHEHSLKAKETLQ